MPIFMTILGYLILPIGWVFSFWGLLSFFWPTARAICNGAASAIYASSRKLRQVGNNTAISRKADR